jgi:hypothetical protein
MLPTSSELCIQYVSHKSSHRLHELECYMLHDGRKARPTPIQNELLQSAEGHVVGGMLSMSEDTEQEPVWWHRVS